MAHTWIYNQDRTERKCECCLMQEMFLKYEREWLWISTDEFIDFNKCFRKEDHEIPNDFEFKYMYE